MVNLPLLHTVETGQRGDGDKDDNSLLAVANFDLGADPKLACELQDDGGAINPWTASRPIPRALRCF